MLGGDIVSLSGLPRNKCVCAAHGVVITPATTGNTSLETGGCMKGEGEGEGEGEGGERVNGISCLFIEK